VTNTPFGKTSSCHGVAVDWRGSAYVQLGCFLHSTRDKAIRSTRSRCDNTTLPAIGLFPRHLPPTATTLNAILDHLDLSLSAGIPWSIVLLPCHRVIDGKALLWENIKEPRRAGGSATRVAKGTCDPHGCLTVLVQESKICAIYPALLSPRTMAIAGKFPSYGAEMPRPTRVACLSFSPVIASQYRSKI
jgi:hypothetical protein